MWRDLSRPVDNMPYTHKKVGNKTCVYKKSTGKKVGCTAGPIKKYLTALHMHDTNESMDTVKKFIKEIVLKEKLKKSIRGIINEVLTEERESPVVRNIKSVENFDALLAKPENVGQPFTKEEIDGIGRMEVSPYKTTATEIRFSATDEMGTDNKELVVRKNNGKYVGFFSVRKPVDVTPDDVTADNPEQSAADDEPQKDEVIIVVSRPLTNTIKDVSLLVNFVTHLTNEYQIT